MAQGLGKKLVEVGFGPGPHSKEGAAKLRGREVLR